MSQAEPIHRLEAIRTRTAGIAHESFGGAAATHSYRAREQVSPIHFWPCSRREFPLEQRTLSLGTCRRRSWIGAAGDEDNQIRKNGARLRFGRTIPDWRSIGL